MNRVTIAEAVELCRTGLYKIHFRPNVDLPEAEQYCLAWKLEDIYE
jgi:hypothetical protein